MTKEFLQQCLAEGLSLEQIGERVGRNPSTVSYHLKRHGLTALGREVHAPNGKVDPERLRVLIAEARRYGPRQRNSVSATRPFDIG